MPPESTQVVDATFYYVVGGMTLMAAAFGNLIILNFVRLRYCTKSNLARNNNGVKSVTSPLMDSRDSLETSLALTHMCTFFSKHLLYTYQAINVPGDLTP